MSEENLLTIAGLRAGYGGKPVLQGVDLAIPRGEITAVMVWVMFAGIRATRASARRLARAGSISTRAHCR